MGVTGLWRLIEPAGKPVPVETLENKVLAVDISIWLHQMVKGYQDAKGAPLPNAHLMGLFQRLCKLLYFRIKPVFVFDGAFPDLKKETIAKRQDNKARYNSQSEKLKREIALLLGKKTAIGALLGNQLSPKKNKQVEDKDDIFKLPALPEQEVESESESDDEQNSSASTVDLHSVDLESDKFKNMPLKEKYDLLVELKETRKMNSWGKIHTLPKKSDNFSDFQMQRLLKRRKLQECLQETEKEIGDGGMSLTELEMLLNEEGIETKLESLPSRRIASNNTTRYLLISNVKQALEDAKKKEVEASKLKEEPGTSVDQEKISSLEDKTSSNQDELDDDLQKAIKMSLECVDEAETSANTSKTDDSWTSFLTDSDYSDDEDNDGFEQPDISSAKAYILQYSDFTHKAIENIVIKNKQKNKMKSKEPKIDDILDELNHEKTIIEDNIELTSSDEEIDRKSDSQKDKIESNKESINNQQVIYDESVLCKEEDKHLPKPNENASPNMNNTQNSAVCVGNPKDDIKNNLKLSSSHEGIDGKRSGSQIDTIESNKESSANQKVVDIGYVLCKEENIHLPKQNEENSPININDTQSSIVCVENSMDEIISLDTSTEDVDNLNSHQDKPKPNIDLISGSSDDDDFEEVSDNDEERVHKPVIHLTLDMGKEVEDDIFADIFENDNSKSQQLEISHVINSPINSEKVKVPDIKEIPVSKELKNNLQQVLEPLERSRNKRNVIDNDTILLNKPLDEISKSSNNEFHHKNPDSDDPSKESSNQGSKEVFEKINKVIISEEKLSSLASEIEKEEEDLLQEKGRLDRIGRNITEQMTKEAQELLRVFGIPYIVAPMEAEAQCAFLENAKLTDGTITDDSDIWLFGGKTVYKNFFNQKKHVLQFLSERIEKSFNLSREQLVLLSLLVGSDYTTGVTGVGPVTALEILASFPFNKKKLSSEQSKQTQYQELVAGLQEFKKWVRAGRRTDNISLKKKLKNVNLTDDFPSVRVVQAYMEPNVEKSEEKFTWGEIDITILREYTKAKFGWSQNKLDEIIKPVLKRILDRKSQKTVHDYFKRKLEFHSLEDQMSKRVKAAVQRMDPEGSARAKDDLEIEYKKQKPKRKRKAKTNDANEAGPSKLKQKAIYENNETKKIDEVVKCSAVIESEKVFDVNVAKSGRYQEIIPQREMDKKHLLENKLKAIELFRKTKIDCKTKKTKRKLPKPKEKAELSESDSD